MRRVLGWPMVVLGSLAVVVACGDDTGSEFQNPPGGDGGNGDACVGFSCPGEGGPPPGCVGLECKKTQCEGGKSTTLTGIVYDPAGKVPIYNATVYVPNDELKALPEGASCDRCDAAVSGKPIAITSTDVAGKFELKDVPVSDKLPLVIQIGKWRRKVEVPTVAKCETTAVDAGITRLPKNRGEGNIPRIALATGAADPLQCLLRKIGLDDTEFGVGGGDERVHLYAGGGVDALTASNKFANGTAFPSATTCWGDAATLKKYDIVLLSCEGEEKENGADARTAMYDYAKAGGRIFASHYHYTWFSRHADAAVKGVAEWAPPSGPQNIQERTPPAIPSNPSTTAVNADISTAFPKAMAMKQWLASQQALSGDKLPIYDARHNIDKVNATALSWITVPNPNVTAPNNVPVQYMTFNTPVGADEAAVCGRVVVSDIHVAAGQQGGVSDDPAAAFPDGCKTADLSAQQKALEFMLFDLSSCVQKDDAPITPPR